MTTVTSLITKIRRLVKDPSSKIITTDAPFLTLVGRIQQDFARQSLCVAKIVELEAPSNIEYSVCYNWEEGFVGSTKVMRPMFKDGTYASSQPFELAGSYNLEGDGYTVTCGDDVMSVDPQHDIPLFPGQDYYKPIMLTWDYSVVSQKRYSDVDDYYNDGWHYRGNVVDFFSHVQGTRRKAIVTRGIPYEKPSDITTTRAQSLVGNTVRDSIFTLAYKAVPERPSATTSSMEVQEPFLKYIEFGVASRILKSYNQLRSLEKAMHFQFRYDLGIQLVKQIVSKKVIESRLRIGDISTRGRKPRGPRLPDHYPSVRYR